MKAPARHRSSNRNRKKALHFAENLQEELEYLDRTLRMLTDQHIRYALGRIYRLVNRLKAENDKHSDREP
jgi:hypothetical protein